MSKIAKRLIVIPENVKVFLKDKVFFAEGSLGKSKGLKIHPDVIIEFSDDNKKILTKTENNQVLAGTYNSLISNIIKGVSQGYTDVLEVKGVGYKVVMKDKKLEFALGRSHLDYVDIPEELEVKVESNSKIIIKGIDKQTVRIFSANKIKPLKYPNPYKKSKGIYYLGEDQTFKIKAGKSLNK